MLHIAPVVEGHGEVDSIRVLLARIGSDLLGGEAVSVLQPIRVPRTKVEETETLRRAINLAALKFKESAGPEENLLVLILVDADDDPPCQLGPSLTKSAQEIRGDIDVTCVVANVEYETWFVAAAASLERFLDISGDPRKLPGDPEANRQGKGWIQSRFRGPKYSETVDQPKMTAAMDLRLCRKRSPSFDKLCRELERRLA